MEQSADWRSWLAYVKRSRFTLTRAEFGVLGIGLTFTIVGAGVLMLKLTPPVQTEHLRKLPDAQVCNASSCQAVRLAPTQQYPELKSCHPACTRYGTRVRSDANSRSSSRACERMRPTGHQRRT